MFLFPGSKLLNSLNEVIPSETFRSERWLSTLVDPEQWMLPDAMLSSIKYHSRNFMVCLPFGASNVFSTALPVEAGSSRGSDSLMVETRSLNPGSEVQIPGKRL